MGWIKVLGPTVAAGEAVTDGQTDRRKRRKYIWIWPTTHIQPSQKSCNRKKTCRYCPRISHTGTITNADESRTYRTITRANCQSSDLVYAITCNICDVPCIYVGKTKNTIVKRFGHHFYDIQAKNDTTVARHFNDHGVNKDPPFQIHVLEYIHRNPETQEGASILDQREKIWMARLNSYYPKGLNIQD